MVYKDKLVACIMWGNEVLREFENTVYLPFNSEYKLYFKNLHPRRACVDVHIDGEPAIKGMVIHGVNSGRNEVELERFVEGFSMKYGPKFQFIQKTDDIRKNRGEKAEDGLVIITYSFEEKEPEPNWIIYRDFYRNWDCQPHPPGSGRRWDFIGDNRLYFYSEPDFSNIDFDDLAENLSVNNSNIYTTYNDYSYRENFQSSNMRGLGESNTNINYCCDVGETSAQNNYLNASFGTQSKKMEVDDGITGYGNDSNQDFRYVSIGRLENEVHTLVFRLRGSHETEKVREYMTTDRKIECRLCGKKWKHTMNFCGNCGNRLI